MDENRLAIRKALVHRAFIRANEEHRIVDTNGKEVQWLFDLRKIVVTPEFLFHLSNIFEERLEKNTPFQLGGMETGAIPLVTGLSLLLSRRGYRINPFYIRKSRKKDGLLRIIEGELTDDPIVLIDDLTNSGNSLRKQVLILEKLGKRIHEIFVVLRYRDEAFYSWFTEKNIPIRAVFSLNDLSSDIPVRNLNDRSPINMDPYDVLWYFKSGGAHQEIVVPKSAPATDDARVYFGSDSGNFWALDATTGKIAWKFLVKFGSRGKYILSSPLLVNDLVIFGAYDGNVYALNKVTGEKVWVFRDVDWVGSSPCMSQNGENIFVGVEYGLWRRHGGIICLDSKTGKKKWEYKTIEYVHASPIYSKKHRYVLCGSNEGLFYALDAKNGKQCWEYRTGGHIREHGTLSPDENFVAFGSEDGNCYLLRTVNGELVHILKTGEAIYSEPLIRDDMLFVASLDKCLYAFDLQTGKMLWRTSTGGRIFSSPVFYNGIILLGSNDGNLYGFDPSNGSVLSKFQVTERIVNKIAINKKSGHIYLPTDANEIYCLRPKSPEIKTQPAMQ